MAKEQQDEEGDDLPLPWAQIQSAIWLVGLAILFWQGWLWPGVLVLVAISGLVQAGMQLYLKRGEERMVLEATREAHLPEACPHCGGPLSAASVRWTSPTTATCPFCNSSIKALESAKSPHEES